MNAEIIGFAARRFRIDYKIYMNTLKNHSPVNKKNQDKNIPSFSKMNDEELLSLRFCDLHLEIAGTRLQEYIARLYKELDDAGILFHPECYLADEWLTPDDEPVIGVAFFLVHPSLVKLEQKMMLDVEGGSPASCMMLLRHEAGHAINYAYKLYRRKKWKEQFGSFSTHYPDKYRYKPFSKRFVQHLEEWYAQYHPDEDFAETFAVWLTPDINWRERYKGWRALKKLEHVDQLMKEIGGKEPIKKTGQKLWQISKSKMILKTYYKRKRKFYAEDFPDFHDSNLKKIFTEKKDSDKGNAASFLRHYRKTVLDNVSLWTGAKKYIINKLLSDLRDRCKELDLRVSEPETDSVIKISSYITTLIINYLYTGSFEKRGRHA
jgi:hypothetical protein